MQLVPRLLFLVWLYGYIAYTAVGKCYCSWYGYMAIHHTQLVAKVIDPGMAICLYSIHSWWQRLLFLILLYGYIAYTTGGKGYCSWYGYMAI